MKRRKNERGRTRKGDRDRDSFDVLCYNTSQSQLKGFVKNAWHAHNWKISNELKEIKIKWFHTHPDFKESTWLEEKKIERGRKKYISMISWLWDCRLIITLYRRPQSGADVAETVPMNGIKRIENILDFRRSLGKHSACPPITRSDYSLSELATPAGV